MAKSKLGPLAQMAEAQMEVDPEDTPRTRVGISGFKVPGYEWHLSADGAMLQVHDESNPEANGFVRINAAQLAWLVKSVAMNQQMAKVLSEKPPPE